MTRRLPACPPRQVQHGVATLAVVMVLFFIIAMTAAYTSRNMIFEQKTSANQYRSTLAIEAAEAGIEWTLAQLNGGLVNDSCGSGSPTVSFQQRYLQITDDLALASNGRVLNRAGRPTGAVGNWPACVFDGSSWNTPAHCACPNDTAATPSAVSGSDILPAFRVWLAHPAPAQLIARPGVVAMQVNGCTKLPASAGERCLDLDPQGDVGDGLATLRLLLALRSALVAPPPAAVTARQGLTHDTDVSNPKLVVVNRDLRTNGVTVTAGGAVNKDRLTAVSLPGVPGELAIVDSDDKLEALAMVAPAAGSLSANERMFVSQFGMTRQTYLEQPGLRRCPSPPSTTCTAADINALLAQHPGRAIWVDGNLSLEANATVGTTAAPALLVIDGISLTLGSNVDITGFVYLTGRTPPAGAPAAVTVNLPTAPTTITGALVSETSLLIFYAGTPAPTDELTVTYSPAVLNTLRVGYGSWVRVPGSWRDFRE